MDHAKHDYIMEEIARLQMMILMNSIGVNKRTTTGDLGTVTRTKRDVIQSQISALKRQLGRVDQER